MFRTGMMALLLFTSMTFLTACSHQQEVMQSELDSIRNMVKQSAMLAVQAACSAPESRADMIQASVTMLRRAMGGSEMAKIHDMMGQMPDSPAGAMSMKPGMAENSGHGNAEHMQMHVAVHDAGERVFELLDALGGSNPPLCKDVQPAQLAAAAALIRESKGPDMDRVQQHLDEQRQHFVRSDIPDTVWQLAQALGRI
ncbi:MAG: hypothetical protein ACE5DZ_00720 [Mariprofundus sp.]